MVMLTYLEGEQYFGHEIVRIFHRGRIHGHRGEADLGLEHRYGVEGREKARSLRSLHGGWLIAKA